MDSGNWGSLQGWISVSQLVSVFFSVCLSLHSLLSSVSELLKVTKTQEQLLGPESKLPTPCSLVIESAGGRME